MITSETIHNTEKEALAELVAGLDAADIAQLVAWLTEKEDNFRYKCFLLLQSRSQMNAAVYSHWDTFAAKLRSENSYQRSLGLMLIAENARWDQEGKFEAMVDVYLSFCDDEKPVTVRQCVQGLCSIVPYKPACLSRIVEKLTAINLMERKETQRKILLMDILAVLSLARKYQPDERIERYFQFALTGGILDSKAKKVAAGM